MSPQGRTELLDELLELANAQVGLVHHADLVARGVPAWRIAQLLADRHLVRVHDLVYAFGHTVLRDEGWWLAGLWVAGPQRSALSHWSAGRFLGWDLEVPRGEDATRDPVHVSTTGTVRSRDDLVVHRVRRLDRMDVHRFGQLRVTSVPRTLVDLADVMDWPAFRTLADGQRTLDLRALRRAQGRAPKRVGRGRVDRLIAADDAHTKSEFERRFLRFCAQHALPRPDELNVELTSRRHKADCLYRGAKLVVELDGRAYHRRRAQMRADRHRDADYQLAGYRILRLVWDDLHPDEARRTTERLRAFLAGAPSA